MSGNDPIENLDLRGYSATVAFAAPNGWYYEITDAAGNEVTEEDIHGNFGREQNQFDSREEAEEAALDLMTEHWMQTTPIDGETLRMRIARRKRSDSD